MGWQEEESENSIQMSSRLLASPAIYHKCAMALTARRQLSDYFFGNESRRYHLVRGSAWRTAISGRVFSYSLLMVR